MAARTGVRINSGHLAAAFALVIGGQGCGAAAPRRRTAADREFASSFEAGEPAAGLKRSTVDNGTGRRRAHLRNRRRLSRPIPGNVTDQSRRRASGENTGGGR